jgi:uncharacterized RDD family membrane protein YckC
MIENKYKTFSPRVVAAFLDGLIIVIPLSLINYWIWSNVQNISSAVLLVWFVVSSFTYVTYSVLMHGFFGQTLGKMNVKVKVLDISENKLSMWQALLRDSVPIIIVTLMVFLEAPYVLQKIKPYEQEGSRTTFMVLSDINFIWFIAEVVTMLMNNKRRAIHDFIAKSVVVKYADSRDYQPSKKEMKIAVWGVIFIILAVVLLGWYMWKFKYN